MLPDISLLKSPRVRRTFIDGVRLARELAFTKDKHDPQLVVEAPEADLVEALGRAGYVHPWLLSYNYRGEDRNLARFFYDDERYPEFPYRQDHIRLYVDEHPPGSVGIAGHTEASSVNHRQAHLEREAEIDPATRRIEDLLDEAGLAYRNVWDQGEEADDT